MRRLLLVVALLGQAACKTPAQAKCNALRTEYGRSYGACNDCMDALAEHGEESVCTSLCEAPCKAGGSAVGACAGAAREAAEARAKAKKKD